MTKSLVGSGGIESLITLHGVLCAFLVSIALGNEPLVAPAAFHRANFYGALYINLYNDPFQKQIYATYGAGGFFLITLFLLVMCFAIASIVAWRWSKHGLKETTMASGDGAKTAEDRQL